MAFSKSSRCDDYLALREGRLEALDGSYSLDYVQVYSEWKIDPANFRDY
jgi:hypothetical protein